MKRNPDKVPVGIFDIDNDQDMKWYKTATTHEKYHGDDRVRRAYQMQVSRIRKQKLEPAKAS